MLGSFAWPPLTHDVRLLLAPAPRQELDMDEALRSLEEQERAVAGQAGSSGSSSAEGSAKRGRRERQRGQQGGR